MDITEEGSDVGDDSDDGDFEPSLNFIPRFVMLISYNFVLITEPCMIICHRSFIIPPLHWKGGRVYCFTSVRPFVPRCS
jgi:hypothetical protein